MSRSFQRSRLSRKPSPSRRNHLVSDNPIMTDVKLPAHQGKNSLTKFQSSDTTGIDYNLDDGLSVNSNGRQYSVYRGCNISCGSCNRTWLERPRHCEFYGCEYIGPNVEIPMVRSKHILSILCHPLRSLMRYYTR